MKLCSKRVLSLLCAVLMLVGLVPAAVALPDTDKMGGDFPWTDKEEPMLIEQILERDGFIDGIWFPWFGGSAGGHGLTGNELMAKYYNQSASDNWARVELDYIGADKIYQQIYNLKAMGYNIMAYGGSIYGEGVIFSESGNVIGIKEDYLNNARRLLDMCREIGMPVMWNVYFHSSSGPQYHGIDGWKTICQMLGNRTVARNYAERFVAPLCEMLAEYPDVVALVSIADEPENEINDPGVGNHFAGDRAMYGVTQADMVYFMKQINDTVREKLPNVARTVASNNENKAIYRDFDLDLMGHNRYADALNQYPNVEDFVTDADPILTEYNLGWNKQTDDGYTQMHIGFREEMVRKGYKGGFSWCWMPDRGDNDDGASYYLIRSRYDVTSFRKCVTDLRYYMDEYRAVYRGEAVGFNAPVMYANYGNGKVLFIPSKGAVSYTVQRSDDGGKTWKDLVVKAAADSGIIDKYLVGRYTDNDSTKPKSGYCYRVIAYDKNGKAATSKPNYAAGHDKNYKETYVAPAYSQGIYYQKTTQTKAEAEADPTKLLYFAWENNRPANASFNLFKNGSFENTTGGQWNNRTFLNESVSVVSDSTTPAGKKSLLFDTTGKEEGWYSFTVSGLKKETAYVLSTWIKGDYLKASNKGMASFGVIDPDTGKFMTYYEFYRGYARASRETQQIYPTAWDKEWHLRSVLFTTGDNTSMTFALYGYGSKMWLDDIALFENGNGIKYTDGTSAEMNIGFIWTDVTCDPRKSAVKDVTVDDKAYWNTGSGWRNGFMSFHESRVTYGNALKYTGSESSTGLYYLKSIPVSKNTDYYLSFDIKILKDGDGRVALMDDQKDQPAEVYSAYLDSETYGTDWFQHNTKFNSGAYDEVHFGVCDLGGSALIDNVRIFKVADENGAVKDLKTSSVKVVNNVAYGKSASVEARATGDGLKYQWYYKNKGASKFTLTTSITGKTYSVKMDKSRDGRQVYCVITDKYGTSRKTATTTLTVKRSTPKITTQPKTAYAKLNATAKATVKATGDGLTYQWYVKNAGATKYSKSSITSATYSVKMTEKVHGRRVYCVVKDAWGKTVQSNTVLLRRAASIVTQPKTVTVKKNTTAKVTVKAAGDGLTYTWYIKNPGQSKYSKSSVKSATYSCKMTAKINGRYVYCVVKDKYGKTVQTKTVRVKMK